MYSGSDYVTAELSRSSGSRNLLVLQSNLAITRVEGGRILRQKTAL